MITEFTSDETRNYQQIDDQFVDLKLIYNLITKQDKSLNFYLPTADASATFKALCKTVKLIEAAGGLVKNEYEAYLVIFRNGKWDLPKGKLEAGEKVRVAAEREVEEECGIRIKKSGRKICKTYHMYTMHDEVILKTTHWYAMRSENQEHLTPQTEEGITKAEWLPLEQLTKVCENTYPSIIEVFNTSGLIKEKAGLPGE